VLDVTATPRALKPARFLVDRPQGEEEREHDEDCD
jgi:hypothetical protein